MTPSGPTSRGTWLRIEYGETKPLLLGEGQGEVGGCSGNPLPSRQKGDRIGVNGRCAAPSRHALQRNEDGK